MMACIDSKMHPDICKGTTKEADFTSFDFNRAKNFHVPNCIALLLLLIAYRKKKSVRFQKHHAQSVDSKTAILCKKECYEGSYNIGYIIFS